MSESELRRCRGRRAPARHGADPHPPTARRSQPARPHDGRRLRALADEPTPTPSVRVVIVTGAGPAFSAGGDLRSYLGMYEDEREFRGFLDDFRALNARLEHGRFVSIAMVNGACVAGGLELALACDLITIADDARIGDGHLGTGQIPGAGGSQRLVRALGVQRAEAAPAHGSALDRHRGGGRRARCAQRAPRPSCAKRTLALAAELAVHSPLAEKHVKTLVGYAEHLGFEEALTAEQDLVVGYATRSHDAKEGLRAFLERRAPLYTGE